MRYYVGTSGWHYDHWQGLFYPEKLPRARWLEYYSHHFTTVEVNNSFYRLPSEQAFSGWRDAAPEDFVFALKVSRYITHVKRLKDSQGPLGNFLSRAKILGPKLGPLLYQLPPNMHRDDERLESFLTVLPGEVKHVLEFRHQSWLDDGVFQMMRRYNVGLCVFDMPDFRCPLLATADFAYLRFHGSAGLYSSSYSDGELRDWAKGIADLGVEVVYAYFNNDAEAFAVGNALALRRELERGVSEV